MIDAQRIALLREELGYHADVAFATAESGACRHAGEGSCSPDVKQAVNRMIPDFETGEIDYVVA